MRQEKKMSVLSPLCLYRHDLFHIEKILLKHLNCAGCDLTITPVEHGHAINGTPFHSFVSMFQTRELPLRTDAITIEASAISPDRELLRDIKVFIGNRIAYLRVLDNQDGAWASTVFDDLNSFLRSKKVWFSFLARAMPPINNTSILISILLIALSLLTGVYQALVFPLIIVSFALTLLTLNLRGDLYSVGRVNLFPHLQDRRPNYERYVIWIYFAVVASCIAGAIATTWEALTAL